MSHQAWPPTLRQRVLSTLMVTLAATGYRRWLSRPWQCSLRDYMVFVCVCSAGLLMADAPTSVIVFVTLVGVAVYASLSLARHGFGLTDIACLLAIILLTAATLLPAMASTSYWTLGKRIFPSLPVRYTSQYPGSL